MPKRKKKQARKHNYERDGARIGKPDKEARMNAARLDEGSVRAEAIRSGIVLHASVGTKAGYEFLHWIFRDESTNEPILHYWPSTQRWHAPAVRESGSADDYWEALELARKLAGATKR